ncbi:MAG TPA: hypothetical protein VMV72_02030 [Verrucomicrobiae bacterium]|nr:hypothetical protein [Verrucomicrobiae bacterium]
MEFDRKIDLDINCRVRRVLVRHWIDLGKVSLSTSDCVVSLGGSLTRLPHIAPDIDGATPASVLEEIKNIPDVRRLQLALDNGDGLAFEDALTSAAPAP